MNYTEITIKGNTYKLRMNTRSTVALEKSLGKNPLNIFMNLDNGEMPKITEIALMFHAALQQYNHSMSIDSVYALIDDYLEEGHSIIDLITLFIEVFQEAGIIPKVEENEKNA